MTQLHACILGTGRCYKGTRVLPEQPWSHRLKSSRRHPVLSLLSPDKGLLQGLDQLLEPHTGRRPHNPGPQGTPTPGGDGTAELDRAGQAAGLGGRR